METQATNITLLVPFENTMIELWKFFKNSTKRLKIYIKVALDYKDFNSLSKRRQKTTQKTVKKACRTRWLSLDAGVNCVFDEYVGLIKALEEMQKPLHGKSACLAKGILKKINGHEFIGTETLFASS